MLLSMLSSEQPRPSVHSQRLHLEVSNVSRNGENTKGIRVPESAFPALHRDDDRAPLDDIQLQRTGQTVPDTIVDL